MRSAEMAIVGAMTLFALLAFLFLADSDLAGRAVQARVAIQNATPANCSAAGAAGLNTVSWPCIATAAPVGDIVGPEGVVAIYQYLPSGEDPWRVYNPSLPGYVVSDLEYLSRRAGYLLVLDEPRTFPVSGQSVASTSIPLLAGWNLVGYPSLEKRDASTAFSPLAGVLDEARTYNASQAAYASYPGSLNTTVPGQGYWLLANASGTWTVTS